ncbi:MAG: signal peptide peptidase SppA [Bacteroidetes bacterium 46-16]|nr:MAG: signal peptide peptidase SppA [Bacteroidetes bacterium 46-16]
MKQFFKMFFASLLAMVVTGVIILGLFIGVIVNLVSKASNADGENKLKANSVLVVDLGKRLHEQGESNSLAAFSADISYNAGLYDALKAIDHAKGDNNIKGILVKLEPSPNGWATMQQLRAGLVDFKKSGKFLYAYGEDITQGGYYIASAADSVFLNPVGGFELKGFATVIPFFKGSLEKLELKPEIFYAGKFKSATEPFRAEKISDPNRAQITRYLQGFWSEFLLAAVQHTHSDTATIAQLANTGAVQFPADAVRYKLVDGLRYWDEVEHDLRSKTGTAEKDKIEYISMDEYTENVKRDRKLNDKKIAVLIAEGSIVDGEQNNDYEIASETLVDNIRKLAKNDKVKAVVLRVNSPGGSALASEVILRELQLLRKKKPLIVSMGDYAASGGYYISCQADSIFAMSNTITGSIGVFSMMFSTEDLMKNKLGVTFDNVKTGPYADFPTGVRTLTADEGQRVQNSVDTIYHIFKSRVAEGRKMDIALVDSFAQGRVWTGSDALDRHLVDGIGGLDRAIKSAAAMAKVSDYQVITFPEPMDKFESLLRKFKGNTAAAAAVQATLQSELGEEYEWYRQLKDLRKMNGKAMMQLPYHISVK